MIPAIIGGGLSIAGGLFSAGAAKKELEEPLIKEEILQIS